MPLPSFLTHLLRRKSCAAPAGMFRCLQRDRSANVLAITAAAMIPMVALTGSAIDISRMYLVKSRVQAACDSGVLAGRKAMTTLIYTPAARTRALAMFNFNFEDSDFDTTGTTFGAAADASGKLTANATTTLPMLVMDFMGFGDYQIAVTCSADIQVPNIDIVFVLDVTASMLDPIGGARKIDSLKTATIGFYDSIAAAMVGNSRSRVRYGFVPYSQIVNGSELFRTNPNFDDLGQLPMSHLIDLQTVQSRAASFTQPYAAWELDTSVPATTFDQRFDSASQISKEANVLANTTGTNIADVDCDYYSANLSFRVGSANPYYFFWPRTSATSEGLGSSVLYKPAGSSTWQAAEPASGTTYVKATFSRVTADYSSNKKCVRRVTHTQYKYRSGFKFTSWNYMPVSYNVANFRTGTAVSYVSAIDPTTAVVPSNLPYSPVQLTQLTDQTGFTRSTTTWNGCLEERKTEPVSSFSPIPSGAWDLNYLVGGTDPDTKWRPMNPDLTYLRTGSANSTTSPGRPGVACPSASMRNLRVYGTKLDFTNYVNSLQPAGNTYLDVGMIWGLRFIAPQGLFAQRNLTGPNGGQISRHIIFLTDGEPVASPTTYSAYGTEQMEKRITGSTGVAVATLHARRFQALCDAERGRVGIWFVGFGPSVPDNLKACADSGRAMQANSTAELNSAFSRIANEVADLRLVK